MPEQVKKLRCLYDIWQVVEQRDLSLEEVLATIVERIPSVWQHADVACARIVVDGREYRTANCRDSPRRQSEDILAKGQPLGFVEVCYLAERPERDEGPFLHAERELLGVLAEQLGHAIVQRRGEEALRESEARYRALVEQIPAVTYTAALDEASTTLYVSPQIEQILGVSREQCLSAPDFWRARLHPDDRQRVLDELARTHATGEPLNTSYRMYSPGGRVVWVRDRASVVRDEGGRPLYLQGAMFDTTEVREVEQQLRQSQKMEAIGHLASGVAHDFRNQLAVIKGYGEMLLRRGLVGRDGREKVQEILDAAERSARLCGQLLMFSRKEILQPEVVDLAVLIAELARSLPGVVGEDVRLLTVRGPSGCFARIDSGQFQQAILNLVVNARQAMPAGGELTVETASVHLDDDFVRSHPDAEPGPYVLVSVRDTGVGMSLETKERIFEPFFTTRQVGEGTGLGLSMVYGFVRQSRGIIDVRSEPGAGSVFGLYFPRVEEAVESSRRDVAGIEVPRGKGTILVAEDEDSVRRMLTQVLRDCGYTVMDTRNAREALPLGEHYEGPIDLLITDVVMPGASGVELAWRIQAVRPGIPVLYISGYTDADLLRRGIDGAEADLLIKPFTHEELASKVQQMLTAAAHSPAEP